MDIEFINEQIILIATVLGAVAALPVLIEFLIDLRKRRHQIALSIDDIAIDSLDIHLAGLDHLLQANADLIDRARDPEAYRDLKLGNEILILGPTQGGKKTLAQKIAIDADMDRLIIVYNPRNPDALVRAKDLIRKYKADKVMLLLPRIDLVFEKENEEVLAELDALIETSSTMSNVLVVGTAVYFEPDGPIDNLFGVKLVLPGTIRNEVAQRVTTSEVSTMLSEVSKYYLDSVTHSGYQFSGMTQEEAAAKILAVANNPAEVEDIVVLCQTSALHTARLNPTSMKLITPQILDRAIQRVIVNLITRHTA